MIIIWIRTERRCRKGTQVAGAGRIGKIDAHLWSYTTLTKAVTLRRTCGFRQKKKKSYLNPCWALTLPMVSVLRNPIKAPSPLSSHFSTFAHTPQKGILGKSFELHTMIPLITLNTKTACALFIAPLVPAFLKVTWTFIQMIFICEDRISLVWSFPLW